jgi:hypothetical protein
MRSRVGFLLALLVPAGACILLASTAAGCSDDADPATPIDNDAATPAIDSSPPVTQDGGSDAPPGDPCLDADGIWKRLECSGLYSSIATKTIAADVKPYKPAVEFWSDGAEKQRWVHLPAGAKIDIADWNEWTYPVGTKLWKEFKLGGKRIETRYFTKLPDNSWAHTTYRWNADETDAVRRDGGETLAGLGPDGGAYEIPSTGQCDTCHRGRKDQVLGFDAVNLGRPTATGQTLAVLAAEGAFMQTPPATTFDLPGSEVAKAAVGWVNANCGSCHNSNLSANAAHRKPFLVRATDLAPTDGGAPLPLEQLDVYAKAYCVATTRFDQDAGASFLYIRGGEPEKSMMSILAGQRTAPDVLPNAGVQMPPIVSRAVDHAGLQLFNDWVTTLPACP